MHRSKHTFKDLSTHSQIYACIYKCVYTCTNLNTFANLITHLEMILHVYKSDYIQTDSEYTFADSCSNSQISLHT